MVLGGRKLRKPAEAVDPRGVHVHVHVQRSLAVADAEQTGCRSLVFQKTAGFFRKERPRLSALDLTNGASDTSSNSKQHGVTYKTQKEGNGDIHMSFLRFRTTFQPKAVFTSVMLHHSRHCRSSTRKLWSKVLTPRMAGSTKAGCCRC